MAGASQGNALVPAAVGRAAPPSATRPPPRKKVKYTRASNGCITCRDRHIKCDAAFVEKLDGVERGGHCLNCIRTGRVCIKREDPGLVIKRSAWSPAEAKRAFISEVVQSGENGPYDMVSREYSYDTPPLHAERLRSSSTPNLPPPSFQIDDFNAYGRTPTACRDLLERSPWQTFRYGEYHGNMPNDGYADRADAALQQPANSMSPLFPTRTLPSLPSLITSNSMPLLTPDLSTSPQIPIDPVQSKQLESVQYPTLPRAASGAIIDPQTQYLLHRFAIDSGPWNDVFDEKRRFTMRCIHAALDCPPLKLACMAVSAKHLSRLEGFEPNIAVQYYNDAIRLLRTALESNEDVGKITISLIILAEYEMMSATNLNFRAHLNGASDFITLNRISAASTDDLACAAFITHARMDTHAAYMHQDFTRIPPSKWQFSEPGTTTKPASDEDWGNWLLVTFADTVNARSDCLARGAHIGEDLWISLRQRLDFWNANMPPQFHPWAFIHTTPFPGIYFTSNPAIISAMQMFSAAYVLLLGLRLTPESEGLQYEHARRVISIAIHNKNIIAWINAPQMIYLAGQILRREDEQQGCLAIMQEIEEKTGWNTMWRRKMLVEGWEARRERRDAHAL